MNKQITALFLGMIACALTFSQAHAATLPDLDQDNTVIIQTKVLGGGPYSAEDFSYYFHPTATVELQEEQSTSTSRVYTVTDPGKSAEISAYSYSGRNPSDLEYYTITSVSGENCGENEGSLTNVVYILESGEGAAICTFTWQYETVVDTTPPVITLAGAATINLTAGDTYIDPGHSISDDTDAGLVATIGGDDVLVNTPGTYVVTYNATDAAGNNAREVVRTVIVNAGVLKEPVLIETIGSGYELAGDFGENIVQYGEVVDASVTITNLAGAEDHVLYLFIAKVNDPSDPEDQGAFTTDHFFVDQKLAVGESKTHNFKWLNDEEAGTYRIFAEVKTVDWSEALQKQQIGFVTVAANTSPQNVGGSLFRFWSDNYKGHFYTTSQTEADGIRANDTNWTYEGTGDKTVNAVGITAQNISDLTVKPVYRFWSENYKHHFYTMSEFEKDLLIENDPNWEYESIAYYAFATHQMDTTEVYRFYSENYKGHFYTSSLEERLFIEANDANWRYEGIAWYIQK